MTSVSERLRRRAPGDHGSPAHAVAVTDLVKSYQGRRALDGLSLTAPRAAITAVLGPNGAGKTTTIECCVGIRSPDSGSIQILGRDPHHHSHSLRALVGVMLQDGGLPGGASAMAVLRHVARLHSDPLDVGALADLLDLHSSGRTTVRRLSGGQRQRLALACAVVGRPHVLFLDEPSAGLDPTGRLRVWQLLRDLRSAGVAIVLTTHSMEEAEALADTVAVVARGRVVASGSVAELTAADREADLVTFTTRPGLDLGPLRTALSTQVAVSEAGPGRYEIRALSPDAIDPQVVATVAAWCAAHGVMPANLGAQRRSLTDVVLEASGAPAPTTLSSWARTP